MAELFDVIVAMEAGDSEAPATLLGNLARLGGVAEEQVRVALRQGAFVVHRGVSAPDATRAAQALRSLGAAVEVRPHEEHAGVAVEVGHLEDLAMDLTLEPEEPSVWLEPVLTGRPENPSMRTGTEARDRPIGTVQTPQRTSEPLEAAPGGGARRSPGRGDESAGIGRWGELPRLELDRPTASPGGAATGGGAAEVPAGGDAAGRPARVKEPARAPLVPRAGLPSGLSPTWQALAERLVHYVWGLTAGVALGIVVAQLGVVELAGVRAQADAWVAELEQAYQAPLQVELGERRAPEAIEGDLRRLGDRVQWRFRLVLLAIGVPFGLGAGRMLEQRTREIPRSSL